MNRVKHVSKRRLIRRRWLVVPAMAAMAGFALPAAPALAVPEDTRILAYRLPCGSTVCDDDAARVGNDEVTEGRVQLQARTSSAIGLSRVEIQLQTGGEWACLERWTTSARSGTWQLNLDLGQRVHGCTGDALTDGSNGIIRARTVATDRSGSQTSATLLLRVSTPPQTPVWASEPERVGGEDGAPAVQLRWHANPEPDIVEYHFIRDDGDRVVEYAVSASRPGAQGCSLSDGIYTCTDDAFPETGYTATYRYALAAFRASPDDSQACSLPGSGSCVRSQNSSTSTLSLREPPPPPRDPNEPERPATRPGGSSNRGSGGGDSGGRPHRPGPPSLSELAAGEYDFEGGSFQRELPYEVDPTWEGALPAPDEELGAFDLQAAPSEIIDEDARARTKSGLTAIALGLLMLIGATFLVRVLRAPARPRIP